MYFDEKFYRLPLDFDHLRLQEEINAVDESHWSPHPQAFKGNDALILLSSGGTVNDLNYGPMQFTPCMAQLPYLKQVLESFNTVIGRTRLMRLAPGEKVGRHSDISLYWWHRFRIHVPIVTHPDVAFYCEDTHVHMQAGEAWTFDNWRYHQVHNNSNITRVHLVIDTVGSPALWNMLEHQSWHPIPGETHTPDNFETQFIPYQEKHEASFEIEKYNIVGVLSPAELDAIVDFVWQDMDRQTLTENSISKIQSCLTYLKRAWRAFHAVHGNEVSAYKNYSQLLTEVVTSLKAITPQVKLKSNGFLLAEVLNTQISLTMNDVLKQQANKPAKISSQVFPGALQESLEHSPHQTSPGANNPDQQISSSTQTPADITLVISAPRSGGEHIEEILSTSLSLYSLSEAQKQAFSQAIKDSTGKTLQSLKEQLQHFNKQNPTQKLVYHHPNIIEQLPSLLLAFPDCKVIFNYRMPREALANLANDWGNEAYINQTASGLTGSKWYHALPDNWQESKLESLEDKLCLQYSGINQQLMDILEPLSSSQLLSLDLDQMFDESEACIVRLCDFCQIPYGPRMQKLDIQSLQIPRDRLESLSEAQCSQLDAAYQKLQSWSLSQKTKR